MIHADISHQGVSIASRRLAGFLAVPEDPCGLVLFVHGSGSSRFSPRNNMVAARLNRARIATLLFDLLSEEESSDRRKVFDIKLLASRLAEATQWARDNINLARLPFGYFGASTGAGAALTAAADETAVIAAIVSRGGRPDLASKGAPPYGAHANAADRGIKRRTSPAVEPAGARRIAMRSATRNCSRREPSF